MSTILKALRRLQEEKSQGESPELREHVVLAPDPGLRARRRWVAAIAAGAIAFALAVVAQVVWERRGADPAAGEIEMAQSGSLQTGPSVAATPAPVDPPAAAPTRPLPPAPSAAPPAPPGESVAPAPTPGPSPTPEPTPLVTATPIATATPVATPRITATPIATPRITPTPRPRATEAVPKPTPMAVPLTVDRTQWHPDPEKRLAWIRVQGKPELQQVREGESIGRYQVRTIEPAAVLFVDGSVEIRRRVGAP